MVHMGTIEHPLLDQMHAYYEMEEGTGTQALWAMGGD